MPIFSTILGAILLSVAISADAFAASFAYGSKKIKIPFSSNIIITSICSLVLVLALLIGAAISQHIPEWLTPLASFAILFLIGVVKLLDSITKSVIKKHNKLNPDTLNKQISFSMFNFRFILNLYANPIDADVDNSKIITPAEAALLALALALDSLAVGFGAALANVNIPIIFLTSFIIGMISVFLGCLLGNKLAEKTSLNISWIGGVILIILAFWAL